MSKSVRSLALAALLALASVPSLHADRTGCNPHPQAVPAPVNQIAAIVYTVVSSLSL